MDEDQDNRVEWAGRKFGDLSPDEQRRAMREAATAMQDELRANADGLAEALGADTDRKVADGRRYDFTTGCVFSTGQWVGAETLRYTAVPAAALAEAVGLPLEDFLTQLRRWCEGVGLPYGISVTDDGRIESA